MFGQKTLERNVAELESRFNQITTIENWAVLVDGIYRFVHIARVFFEPKFDLEQSPL